MRRTLKGLGLFVGGVVVLVVVLFSTAYGVTAVRMNETWDIAPTSIEVEPTEEAIARGRHLFEDVARCAACHGDDLGGRVFEDIPGMITIIGPNLTSGEGGVTEDLTPRGWVGVIRDCVRPDGSGLVLMPCMHYPDLSDADIAAIVAYAQSVPPVNRRMDPSTVGPMGRVMWLFGVMPMMAAPDLEHDGRSIPAVDTNDPVAHGRYLARAGGCLYCHGETLSGGPLPGAPDDIAVPRNLTFDPSGLQGWSEENLGRAVRDGRSYPGDRPLDPLMPFEDYHGMTDDEIHALYSYLESLPHRRFGGH